MNSISRNAGVAPLLLSLSCMAFGDGEPKGKPDTRFIGVFYPVVISVGFGG